MLKIEFEVTAEQVRALLDMLRAAAGEDYFKAPAEVRTFYEASDACRVALREALTEDEPGASKIVPTATK